METTNAKPKKNLDFQAFVESINNGFELIELRNKLELIQRILVIERTVCEWSKKHFSPETPQRIEAEAKIKLIDSIEKAVRWETK